MSSRARRAAEPARPFDWGSTAASTPASPPPPQARAGEDAPAVPAQHLAALERDAFAKGYAQGERAGADVAAQRADAMIRRLGQTIDELSALRTATLHRSEQQVVQLAIAIAKRLVGREIAADRGLLVAMARVALDRLGERGSARIRLHPDDHAAIGAGAGTATAGGSAIEIVVDPLVSRGGCFVDSDFGFMDASVDAQFEELTRTLIGDSPEPQAEAAHEAHAIIRR